MKNSHSTESEPGQLPYAAETGDSVSSRVEKSLPPLDISLVSEAEGQENAPQPMNEELRAALEESAPRLPRRPRTPRRRSERPAIELDHEFSRSPEKMNYALLLALLLRAGGVVKLTQADLERAADEQNILFALSPDATYLEVSVVSTESGIIRSPEAKWAPNQTQPIYAAPPLPGEALQALEQLATQPQYTSGANPQLEPSKLVQMPPPQQHQQIPPGPPAPTGAAGEKPAGYVFPFETGQSPQTASRNLESLQSELAKDRQVALQESQAASKVEGHG